MFKLRNLFAGLAVGLASLSAAAPAWAWPDRPVELIVGFAPGGGTDLTARALAVFLEKELGGSVVVVNKPGASSAIALSYVARAKPDGYTLAMTNMPGLRCRSSASPVSRRTISPIWRTWCAIPAPSAWPWTVLTGHSANWSRRPGKSPA